MLQRVSRVPTAGVCTRIYQAQKSNDSQLLRSSRPEQRSLVPTFLIGSLAAVVPDGRLAAACVGSGRGPVPHLIEKSGTIISEI